MITISVLTVLAIVSYVHRTLALSCSKTETGEFEFFDAGRKLALTNFHCMKVTIDRASTLVVSPPLSPASPSFCRAVEDGIAKTQSRYEKVDVNTGIMCTYECREQTGQYRCRSKPANEECPCEEKAPRVVVKPISSELGAGVLSGQSEVGEETTCVDKEEGFQFPDAIGCISIRAEVDKRRVWYKKGSTTKCRFNKGKHPETRWMPAPPTENNLQGCMWVCKRAAPRCTELTGGDECDCKSPGLQKILVPLEEEELNGLIRQTKCVEHSECGSCGDCATDGRCVLKEKAWEKNYCPCGEICPMTDKRENPGAALLCVPNTKLLCMAEPKWESSSKDSEYRTGTDIPDFCREKAVDASDECGCRDGYEEVLEKDGVIKCKLPEITDTDEVRK